MFIFVILTVLLDFLSMMYKCVLEKSSSGKYILTKLLSALWIFVGKYFSKILLLIFENMKISV